MSVGNPRKVRTIKIPTIAYADPTCARCGCEDPGDRYCKPCQRSTPRDVHAFDTLRAMRAAISSWGVSTALVTSAIEHGHRYVSVTVQSATERGTVERVTGPLVWVIASLDDEDRATSYCGSRRWDVGYVGM